MADHPIHVSSLSTSGSLIMGVLRRPIEFGLIGAAVVLVLHLANQADILPKVFKGAGIELEFRENQQKVVQTVVDTAGGVDEIKQQVADLQAEIKLLKKDIVELAGSTVTVNAAVESAPTESKQDIAITARQLVEEAPVEDGTGVIWIGTYDSGLGKWTDSSFLTDDALPPSELAGEKIRLTSDINVREAFPENGDSYFSDIKALGVASDGFQGKVLGKPRSYERPNGTQYWAEIAVTYRPYIGVE